MNHEISVGGVPISYAADEGRDQEYAGIGTGTGLLETKNECGVAVDTALLEYLGRTNALPGRRHLNQHTIAADARVVIEPDQFLGFGDGRLSIEREACVDFCADHARDDLIDPGPNAHCKAVDFVRHSITRRFQRRDFVSKLR